MTVSRYEHAFDPEKPNNTAASVFRMAREGGTRVLDLGSGPGIVAGALATLLGKDVTCVDLLDEHLESAAQRGVSRTVQGDLSTDTWISQLAGEQFDVIILADVLEHLVNPATLVRRIREHDLLTRSGFLIISIPNASHIAILASLAAGDFPYRPTGLLDETHLRFFTLTSLHRLLEVEGFTPSRVVRTVRQLQETELRDVGARVDPAVVTQLQQQHSEADAYQYVVRAERLSGQPGPNREELDRMLRQRRKARKRARQHEARAAELEERALESEERIADLEGITARSEAEKADLQIQVNRLEAELEAVYASRAWRLGRLATAPRRLFKR